MFLWRKVPGTSLEVALQYFQTMSEISLDAEARLRRKKNRQSNFAVNDNSAVASSVNHRFERTWAWLPFNPPSLNNLEQNTGIPKVYIVIFIFLSFVAVFLHFEGLPKLASAFGLIYPLYQTFRALELEDEDDEGKRPLWLTYWIVFGFMHFFCSYGGDWVLSRIVPFYYVLKIAFVVWLFNSSTQGVQKVYIKILRPFLLMNAKEIGAYISVAQNRSNEASGWIVSRTAFSPQTIISAATAVSISEKRCQFFSLFSLRLVQFSQHLVQLMISPRQNE